MHGCAGETGLVPDPAPPTMLALPACDHGDALLFQIESEPSALLEKSAIRLEPSRRTGSRQIAVGDDNVGLFACRSQSAFLDQITIARQ